MAELKGNGGGFFKFEKAGDSITGKFVSVNTAKPSPWGPKTEVTLDCDGDITGVTCPAVLAGIIKENREMLEKDLPVITITLTGTKPSGKGNPLKLFKVETVSTPF